MNREFSVLSGIFRVQVELENLDFNPCLGLKGLPENQRDTYLSWKDFNLLLGRSWWLRGVGMVLYHASMRFEEVGNFRSEIYKPERMMVVTPAMLTKEGKNERKRKLHSKKTPVRQEVVGLPESPGKEGGDKLIRGLGPLLTYWRR